MLRASLDAYAARLRARFGDRVQVVALFGSWARGEATERSDVDVAVVIDRLSRDEWRAALADAVDFDADVALAPYVVSTSKWDELRARRRRIARDIEHEGVRL